MHHNLFRLILCASLGAILVTEPMYAEQRTAGAPLPAPALQPAPPPSTATLPKGTEVEFALLDSVSSATAVKGQLIHFAVAKDVISNGTVLIPRGTPVYGVVRRVRKGVPGKHDGDLFLEPHEILLSNHLRLIVRRNPPGEDDCASAGPCWAIATFAIVFSPVLVPTVVVASPWLIHDKIKEKKRFPHTKPQIAGKDETTGPCEFHSGYTASRLAVPNNPGIVPVAEPSTLAQLASCPSR